MLYKDLCSFYTTLSGHDKLDIASISGIYVSCETKAFSLSYKASIYIHHSKLLRAKLINYQFCNMIPF